MCVCDAGKVEGLNKNLSVFPPPLIGRPSESFLPGGFRPRLDHWTGEEIISNQAEAHVGKRSEVPSVLCLLARCSAKSNMRLHSMLFWLKINLFGCWSLNLLSINTWVALLFFFTMAPGRPLAPWKPFRPAGPGLPL